VQFFAAEKYAVLITGQAADHGDPTGSWALANPGRTRHTEFWYDTAMLFNMLIRQGFEEDNIYVLYGEGLDYDPPDITMPAIYLHPLHGQITDYRADREHLEAVLTGLAEGNQELGIPQLNDDDFLFLWTFDHGGHESAGSSVVNLCLMDNVVIWDWEFAALLEQIDSQKKVVWMQQCFSGGFIDDLEALHQPIVVNTASEYSTFAQGADDIPVNENEVVDGVTYYHGEFNYHTYSSTNGASPSGLIHYAGQPYTAADLNGDGVISVYESSVWAFERDTVPAVPQYGDFGNIGQTTSLQYPNLVFEDIDDNISLKGIVAITEDVSITNNSILTIQTGTKLYLINTSRLTVDGGSSIVIEDNVQIFGETATQFENTPQEIAGNRIIVNGSALVGNNVLFTALNNQSWDGLYLNGTGQSVLLNVTFENCNLFSTNGSLLVRDSNLDQSLVSCSGASMDFRNCNITGKMAFNNALEVILDHVTAIGNDNSQPTVKVSNTPSLTLKNNTAISGLGEGLELNSCRDYSITNCNISNNTGNGISIYETNGMYNYMISDCDISHNIGAGIRFYNSIGNITSCSITENDYQGISAFRVSNLTIQKDPNTAAYYRDCYIANNGMQEISFVNSTNLFADRAKNMIVDNSFALGTFDQYLVYCPNMDANRWVRLNFWGYRDNHSIAIMPPENRFYPECTEPMLNEVGYYLSPVWDPGIPRSVDPDNDEIIFQTAIDAALDENASLAITLFKQLISEYPESKFSSASAKHLFALEEDKQALKNYYQTEPNLHYNGEIDKIIDYLTTHCNIKLGNYQEAISWFEDVISNPESELDSLMAVIDLGYVYMLMEGDDKASVTCRYPQLKPKTMSEYETNRESTLVNLFGNVENQAGYTDSEYDQQAIVPVLESNFPNPFNPSTTISFLLPKDAICTLEVFNIRGQKVKTLINETRFAGNHSVVWNGLDDNGKPVSSGLYLYRLTTPNSSQTNKMLLLK
jgi:tetratricopeptide (TPR) repeat protein